MFLTVAIYVEIHLLIFCIFNIVFKIKESFNCNCAACRYIKELEQINLCDHV